MYRRYEDPYRLEQELDNFLATHPEEDWDEFDYETVADLKERINFAWQDDEADACGWY